MTRNCKSPASLSGAETNSKVSFTLQSCPGDPSKTGTWLVLLPFRVLLSYSLLGFSWVYYQHGNLLGVYFWATWFKSTDRTTTSGFLVCDLIWNVLGNLWNGPSRWLPSPLTNRKQRTKWLARAHGTIRTRSRLIWCFILCPPSLVCHLASLSWNYSLPDPCGH